MKRETDDVSGGPKANLSSMPRRAGRSGHGLTEGQGVGPEPSIGANRASHRRTSLPLRWNPRAVEPSPSMRAWIRWAVLVALSVHVAFLSGCSTTKEPGELTASDLQAMRESQAREKVYEQRKQALASEHERKAMTSEAYTKGVAALDELGRKEIDFQRAIVRKEPNLGAFAHDLLSFISSTSICGVPMVLPVMGGALAVGALQELADSIPEPPNESPGADAKDRR